MVGTPCLHCQGPEFNPWIPGRGTGIPQAAWHGQKEALGDTKLWVETIKESFERVLNNLVLERRWGTSVVAQWLRIGLPMQGTWVRSLLGEDPTCRGATKPVRHNC